MATRIVILGGGFGGAYTAQRLERYLPEGAADVTLVSRENFFLMTPLLFEAGSGTIEFRHAVNPIRPMIRSTRFLNAAVDSVDIEKRLVRAHSEAGDQYTVEYDHLVLALGQVTNTEQIPGSEHALPFKTVADAIRFRNHVIGQFERAEAEADPEQRKRELTFVVVGGGLVGVELVGELTEFIGWTLKTYKKFKREDVRIELLQHGPRILPELPENLGQYAHDQYAARGVQVRVNTGAKSIEEGKVNLPSGEVIEANTIILAAGIAPNPVVAAIDIPKTKGRVTTDGCMRVENHPGLWAIGDCAAIPGPDGKPYPTLAQHALRESKVLAKNLVATLAGQEPKPFKYKQLGTMAALGRHRGVADALGIKIKGFLAFVMWRGYYLMQMNGFERKFRVLTDWTIGLVFSPDTVKVDIKGRLGFAAAHGEARSRAGGGRRVGRAASGRRQAPSNPSSGPLRNGEGAGGGVARDFASSQWGKFARGRHLDSRRRSLR